MSWEISGKYVVNCDCQLICSCAMDGPPTGKNGECRGTAVFHIASGRLDDTDLSGVDVAFCFLLPSNLMAGNWKVGIVVDGGASDGQAQALERILHGDEGGPFGDFAALYGEWLGVERGNITFSGGDAPSASVDGRLNLAIEPLVGPDGGVTTIKNAMYGFAPEFVIGKGTGGSDFFGLDYQSVYAESADYTFASEMA